MQCTPLLFALCVTVVSAAFPSSCNSFLVTDDFNLNFLCHYGLVVCLCLVPCALGHVLCFHVCLLCPILRLLFWNLFSRRQPHLTSLHDIHAERQSAVVPLIYQTTILATILVINCTKKHGCA